MKNILKNLPQALLILLYVYAVVSKLTDIEEFRAQLYNQTFPHAWAEVLYIALPVTEMVVVGCLLFPSMTRFGLWLSLLLLILFTGYIGLVKLHYWDRVPCSCGGILSKMSWTTHLIFNLIYMLINLAALYFQRQENSSTGNAENLEQSRPHLFT